MSGDNWAEQAAGEGEQPQQAVSEWQAGNYSGEFKSHELMSSSKGTPGIRLWFDVSGVDIPVDMWLSEKSSEIAVNQLAKLNWNGDFENAEFTPDGPVKLWLKKDEYKGKPQDKWSISSVRPPPQSGDPFLKQFAAKYKQMTKAPPPAPTAKPKGPTPPKAPPKPAPPPPVASAPPKPGKAPPKPAKPAQPIVVDQDTAWAAWEAAKLGGDPEGFWARVAEAGEGAEPEAMTAEQWKTFAGLIPPF